MNGKKILSALVNDTMPLIATFFSITRKYLQSSETSLMANIVGDGVATALAISSKSSSIYKRDEANKCSYRDNLQVKTSEIKFSIKIRANYIIHALD